MLGEIERQTIMYDDKCKECEAWKKRFNELDANNREKDEIEDEIREYKERVRVLSI